MACGPQKCDENAGRGVRLFFCTSVAFLTVPHNLPFGGGGELSANGFRPFAHLRYAFPAVRCFIDQLFEVSGKLWSIGCPNFTEDWLDLGEDADVLAVG